MDLERGFKILDLYEEEERMTCSSFSNYIERELIKVLSTTKELEVTKEKEDNTTYIVINYKNKDRNSSEKPTIDFDIIVKGFNQNGRSLVNGVYTEFVFNDPDRDVKAMRKVTGTPKKVASNIVSWFKDNIKALTKIDDITSKEEFSDAIEEEGEGGVGVTTGDIAVHKTPLGKDDRKKKLNNKF